MSGSDEAFAALQARLRDDPPEPLATFGRSRPRTVIGLPSIDFGTGFAQRNDVPALEARWLYLLLALARPHARVAMVTAEPVSDDVVDYLLGVAGAPPGARERLGRFTVGDRSRRPLARKLLDRPDVVAAVRAFAGPRAFIHPFAALSEADRDAALALDTPVLALDHRFERQATKSGGRALLAAAGVPIPRGAGDLRTVVDLVAAVAALRAARDPDAIVLKLDRGVTGSGNAVVGLDHLPPAGDLCEASAIEARVRRVAGHLLGALADGAVVEERIDGPGLSSPSVQVRIPPGGGSPELIATHDQVLGGPFGQSYAGCHEPAGAEWRGALARHGLAVARELGAAGAAGRVGIDFVATRRAGGRRDLRAVEVNPREGATTHTHGTLALLEHGATHVRASDSVVLGTLRGTRWQDALAVLEESGLAYDARRGAGVVLYMLDAMSRTGRLSVVALGGSRTEADALFTAAVERLRNGVQQSVFVAH